MSWLYIDDKQLAEELETKRLEWNKSLSIKGEPRWNLK